MTTPITLATSDATAALSQLPKMSSKLTGDIKTKAHAMAQDFEAVFLNTMFQQMFTDIGGDGPFGGSKSIGVWRSFLTDEYSKAFAKRGGIGIADQVYHSLIQQQEARQQ
jgi:Rod binding domain-containing protein